MAPPCECGHKASEHRKQMSMRTRCTADESEDDVVLCACQMYRPKEDHRGH